MVLWRFSLALFPPFFFFFSFFFPLVSSLFFQSNISTAAWPSSARASQLSSKLPVFSSSNTVFSLVYNTHTHTHIHSLCAIKWKSQFNLIKWVSQFQGANKRKKTWWVSVCVCCIAATVSERCCQWWWWWCCGRGGGNCKNSNSKIRISGPQSWNSIFFIRWALCNFWLLVLALPPWVPTCCASARALVNHSSFLTVFPSPSCSLHYLQ